MSEYRYFTYSDYGDYPAAVWRYGPEGVQLRGRNGWSSTDFTDLEDFLGPDDEDLKNGALEEVPAP